MLLGLVDVAILGHASSTELGGASIGRSIGFASLSLGIGASSALEPLAAQAVGAGEDEQAWHALVATLKACTLVWAPCALLAIAATFALEPIGIDRALVGPARAFLVAQMPGLLGFTLFLTAKTYLQAHRVTVPALVATVVANVVNVIVCNALVHAELRAFGHSMSLGFRPLGALGAGMASSVASIVMAVWMVIAAYRRRPPLSPTRPKDAASTKKVLRLGMPIGMQLLTEIGVFSLVAVLAGRLGAVAVASHQIAIGLASFTFMGVLGISGATAVRVGHAIGERRSPRQPGLLGIGLGAAFMLVSGAVFLTIPELLIRLFTDDPNVVALGVTLLRIAAGFQLFDGVQGVAAGALRGAGDVRMAFVVNLAAHWLVGFPLAMLLGFHLHWGAPGFWWGLLVGLFLVAVFLTWRFVVITRGPVGRV
ncbi:Multi antimicrobial extrusion protein [Labilithrix luteola]|uniref:Multi antimicrobial extrusion protein n=2 Tax=Labilithrix luteola TaxID=1391654 RepID=A0A0K1Q9U7_9BACT|nr:Multi antimicrobial extrusion protein [Labilithrix luteola]